MSAEKQQLITGEIMISDMVENYPQVVDFLVIEYGFHCVSCFVSSFECLEDGARVHGIVGEDFDELLENANKIARGEMTYTQ
jgi:hybrid cluster-associated redox disulfide protein